MRTKIYIVFGRSGEYEDSREWDVAIYYSEGLAQKRMTNCQNWVNSHFDVPNLYDSEITTYEEFDRITHTPNPFDENMQYDSNGISYNYYENEIEDSE